MSTLCTAAQQALEALSCLEYDFCGITDGPSDDTTEAAITALRAALAEPACCCGEPSAPGIVHRRDGPCYMAEPDYWQEEARRYAGNADYWRKRYETLAEPVPDSKHATIAEWWADKQCPNCASLQDQNAELDRKLAEMERKPLDDLAIADIYTKWDATPGTSMADFARAIESAHGIKDA